MFQQENAMLLTVVELIFALLISFFLVLYLSQKLDSAPEYVGPTVEELKVALENTKTDLENTKEALENTKRDLATANANLEERRKGLKSKQTPSCIETGFSQGAVAEITILNSDKYMLHGKEHSFQELKANLNKDIENARNANCVHSVNVSAIKHISTQDYDEGLRKLEQFFYIKRLKVK